MKRGKVEPGLVSVWVGTAPSIQDLERYVELRYDKKGRLLASQFLDEWGLRPWDESFREATVLQSPEVDLAALLEGFSYGEEVVSALVVRVGGTLSPAANAAVLLYDYAFHGEAPPQQGSGSLRFLGAVPYA